MKMITAVAFALAASLLTGCRTPDTLAGEGIRKKGSYRAKLGLVGYKSDHAFERSGAQPTYDPPLTVSLLTRTHDESSRKHAYEAAIEAQSVGKVNTGISAETSVKGDYDVVAIDDDLPSRLNDPRNKRVLDRLIRFGTAARIITLNKIAYGHEQTRSFDFKAGAEAKYEFLTGTVKGASSGSNLLRLSDGTIYSYEFSRIAWAKDPEGRIIVDEVIPDRPGPSKRHRWAELDPTKLR